MCSSSLQRKTSRLYRCKRKKENQGPRRKYERDNMPGALEVADVGAIFIHTKLCRASLNNQISSSRFFFQFSRSRISIFFFPVLTVAKTHPHLSFGALSFSFPFHTVNRYITHSLPSRFSSSIFRLSLSLSHSLSRSLFLSVSLSFLFTLFRSHRVQ